MELHTSTVNTQLVESLIQVIQSLSTTEQAMLLDKLLGESPVPSTLEMMHLADQGGAFDFWHDEPDLYSLDVSNLPRCCWILCDRLSVKPPV